MADKHHSTETKINPNQRCACAEDDNCGCTYPENMTDMENTEKKDFSHESYKIRTAERFIAKDTTCYCSPKNCDCKIEYHETDNL